MAILAPSLARLRSDFNVAFPNRDKTTDGWIGDARHRESTSDHNPDDTPGSRSATTDADNVAEVRGLDLDKDLRDPRGTTLQAVVDRIIRTERDRRRLRYVIFRRRIASRNAGWFKADGSINWQPYSGDNTHDEHAHFSGDPAYDNDNAPWASVQGFIIQQGSLMADFDTTTPFNRPDPTNQDGDIGWSEVEAPAKYGDIIRHMGWRVWVMYKQVKLILTGVNELRSRPAQGLTDQQYDRLVADLIQHVDTMLAAKIGEAMESALESDRGQAAIVAAVNVAERT
jgi:hypothetical protein